MSFLFERAESLTRAIVTGQVGMDKENYLRAAINFAGQQVETLEA